MGYMSVVGHPTPKDFYGGYRPCKEHPHYCNSSDITGYTCHEEERENQLLLLMCSFSHSANVYKLLFSCPALS
jgi:hypothetical protein